MKKLFKFFKPVLTLLFLLIATAGISANLEAYAVFTTDENDEIVGKLTFYYDNQKDTRPGTVYELNEGSNVPLWLNDLKNNDTRVVFDPSFADARPTSTYSWFNYSGNSKSIVFKDMQYLNTSCVTNMDQMFYQCSSLTSLDLSGWCIRGGYYHLDMSSMFSNCYALISLNLSEWKIDSYVSDVNMNSMFSGCQHLGSLNVS